MKTEKRHLVLTKENFNTQCIQCPQILDEITLVSFIKHFSQSLTRIHHETPTKGIIL